MKNNKILIDYLSKKDFYNDLVLKSLVNKLLSENNDIQSQDCDCMSRIKNNFGNLDNNLLKLICNDLSFFDKNLNESDFNTVVYHRIIITHVFNYLQTGLENYIIEEKTESFDIKINGYRMEINLKKTVNLNWTVNKLKSYFKKYYMNNKPEKIITSISINNNELQLM